MSSEELKKLIGSYDDWDEWRTVRYNLFEIKERFLQIALLSKHGLTNDEIENEFDEGDKWQNEVPIDWAIAHLVAAINEWLGYHSDNFLLGEGPTYGSLRSSFVTPVDNALRTMEFDLDRAVDLLLTRPLYGRDLELFATILEVQDMIVMKDVSTSVAPVKDPRAALATARNVARLREQGYGKFEKWIDDAANHHHQWLLASVTPLVLLSNLRVRADADLPLTKEHIELFLMTESLEFDDDERTPSEPSTISPRSFGQKSFSILDPIRPRRTAFELTAIAPSDSANDQLLYSMYEERYSLLMATSIEPLKKQIATVLEELQTKGIELSKIASYATEEERWAHRETIFRHFTKLDFDSQPSDRIGALQYIGVALLSPLSPEPTFKLLPDSVPMFSNPEELPMVPLVSGGPRSAEPTALRRSLRDAFRLRVNLLALRKLYGELSESTLIIDTEGIDLLPGELLVMHTFRDAVQGEMMRWSLAARAEIASGVHRIETPYFSKSAAQDQFWHNLETFSSDVANQVRNTAYI